MKHAFALVLGLVLLSLCTPALAAEAPPAASTSDPALLAFLDSLAPAPTSVGMTASSIDWRQPVVAGCPIPEDCGGCYACGYLNAYGHCCWVCC